MAVFCTSRLLEIDQMRPSERGRSALGPPRPRPEGHLQFVNGKLVEESLKKEAA